MGKLATLVLLVCGSALIAAFACPAGCFCDHDEVGLTVFCVRLKSGATLSAGFLNQVTNVSQIFIRGSNITVGENAFAFIQCAENGSITFFQADIFEILGHAFQDIEGCNLAFKSVGHIHENGFHHLRNVTELHFWDIDTVATGAFNDITGAGSSGVIHFVPVASAPGTINKIESRGFSNIVNFKNILFSVDIGTMARQSFFNVTNIDLISFDLGSVAEVMPYAFEGLSCCAGFRMSSISLQVLSDNAFSGMRNIKYIMFLKVETSSIGRDIFGDIKGVVALQVVSSESLPKTLPPGTTNTRAGDQPCVYLPDPPETDGTSPAARSTGVVLVGVVVPLLAAMWRA